MRSKLPPSDLILLGGVSSGESDKRIKILLIENSIFVSGAIEKSLADFEVDITTCFDGYEALGKLLKNKFDVLLTSRNAPLIEAEQLAAILKIIPSSNRNIGIIIMTTETQYKEKNQREGVSVVSKGEGLIPEIREILKKISALKNTRRNKSGFDTCKILIIDDSKEIHQLVKSGFKNHSGIKIESCLNAEEAELSVIKNNPDIILLDVQMPAMTGYQVFNQLKSKKLIDDKIVFFLTATDNPNELNSLISLGPKGILKKPFRPKELPEKIRKAYEQVS